VILQQSSLSEMTLENPLTRTEFIRLDIHRNCMDNFLMRWTFNVPKPGN
jgi:hypothetical protein